MTNRMKQLRDKRQKAGLVEVSIWTKPELKEEVMKYDYRHIVERGKPGRPKKNENKN